MLIVKRMNGTMMRMSLRKKKKKKRNRKLRENLKVIVIKTMLMRNMITITNMSTQPTTIITAAITTLLTWNPATQLTLTTPPKIILPQILAF
jgi:hypothetical protein